MMASFIQAKTILLPVRQGPENIFGLKYNMNLYRGCQHGCIYCDSRSTCYKLGELSDIRIKENALDLLEKELRSKRVKGTIGFGSMNDPYMPVEKDSEITGKALKIISKYKFPVHIITKSDLVLRDLDILKEIGKSYAAVSLTITTNDDRLSQIIEPAAPLSSKRFEAIRRLSEAGIYTGIVLMPVLPFITDNKDNIEGIVNSGRQNGASYILAFMGMTLREGQREYFYKKLDIHFPGLKDIYMKTYGNLYGCSTLNHNELNVIFHEACKNMSLKTTMDFYAPQFAAADTKQMTLF
jgi:DNA repair photolyase